MTYLLLLFAFFYAALVALLFFSQRHMIYHPLKTIGEPYQYGLEGFQEYLAPTGDGQTIQLWHRPADKAFPTIVYFHGNTGHMGDRASLFSALSSRGFGVLAVSYRGYGKSTGKPTEPGLYADARGGIEFLKRQFHLELSRLIFFGESLGTGVAVQMAVEYKPALLVLQAPYRSISARAAELYYYIPVRLLIKDKYNTISKIAHVACPLVVFHGERDEVIPIAHGKSVFDAATSPKHSFFFPERSHNDFDSAVISEHVLQVAENYNLINR